MIPRCLGLVNPISIFYVDIDDIRSPGWRPKLLAYCVSRHTARSLCRKYVALLAAVVVALKEQTTESPDFIPRRHFDRGEGMSDLSSVHIMKYLYRL